MKGPPPYHLYMVTSQVAVQNGQGFALYSWKAAWLLDGRNPGWATIKTALFRWRDNLLLARTALEAGLCVQVGTNVVFGYKQQAGVRFRGSYQSA